MTRRSGFLLAVTAACAALLLDGPAWLAYQAEKSYRSGDVAGAVSTWTTLIRMGGNQPERRYNRGVAWARMGHYSAAVADFRSSASSRDTALRSRSLYNLGTCRLLQSGGRGAAERYATEAVVALRQCLAVSPSDPDAAANLEEARRRLGNLSDKDTERQKAPKSPLTQGSRGSEGKRSDQAKEPDRGAEKPGKATAKDQAAVKRRPALPAGEALRMLDEARGRERLRSAVRSSDSVAAAAVPEKDW